MFHIFFNEGNLFTVEWNHPNFDVFDIGISISKSLQDLHDKSCFAIVTYTTIATPIHDAAMKIPLLSEDDEFLLM